MKNEEKKGKNARTIITVALCFVMIFCGLGLWAQKGLFLAPITDALGITRTAYSFADTCRYITTAIVNIFFGYFVNKFGARKLIIFGFIALTLAPLCYAFATNVWLFYLGGCFLGVGFSFGSTAIVGYVINKVCRKNKGTVMGAVLCANGVAGAVVALITTPIIESGVFGYKKAFYLFAIISVVALLLFILFFKEPQDAITDGEQLDKQEQKENWKGITYAQALKKKYFYLACVCILLTGLVLTGVISNYAAHLRDRGFNANQISVIAVVSSIALAVFKFLNGFVYDRAGLRVTITIDCVAALLVMVVLYFIVPTGLGFAFGVIYAILGGMALPLETVMLPIYVKDLFGQRAFSKVLGIFVSLNQVGYALGAPLMNLAYDLSGSYNIGLIISAIAMAITIILLQWVITSANKLKKLPEEQLTKI
ncbi:MAG: MFS transporter [Clostridia bacterium]|nr:MFS transporter [Clostridia bacterium]